MIFLNFVAFSLLATVYGKPISLDSSSVSTALNTLVSLDTRVDSLVKLNYQNMASKKDPTHDNAKDPLFTSVDVSVLQGKTYTALLNLLTFYSNLDSNSALTITSAWNSTIDQFLDVVTTTPVMQSATQFLISQNLVTVDSLRSTLYSLWFTPYSRASVAGSSGFKSVFAGESTSGVITRLSNWVRFFQFEKKGVLNYHGWFEKDNAVAIDLQFTLNDLLAAEKTILLNSSPEFEIAAYTICALAGTECNVEIEGNSIQLNVQLFNGSPMIDNAHPTLVESAKKTTVHGKETTKKSSGGSSDPSLQAMVDNMWQADTDKPRTGDVVLDWGNKVSGQQDTSKNPLFTSVNESYLFGKRQYVTLIDTFDKNLFTPDVCTAEPGMDGFRKQYFLAVFNAFTDTTMFGIAFDYMKSKGVKGTDNLTSFKNTVLWPLWFGTYSRCKGVLGSSGWEHVFSGEWKSGDIDGQHDWVRYYLLEKAGKINYHGYYNHDQDLIGTFQYTWENELKPKGGFFTGTSPAFDFSILTACALTHSGANGCRFNLSGFPISVTSYTQACGAGTCLSTAYPSGG